MASLVTIAGRLSTRELIVAKTRYIVPYRVRGETVEVLRVFDSSRRLPERW
jgi:plasmid stabilization system protein ParE